MNNSSVTFCSDVNLTVQVNQKMKNIGPHQ